MSSESRPRPVSLGRRPVASSSRSASMRVPSSSASVRPSGVRSALVAGEPRKVSTPARRRAAGQDLPGEGGLAGQQPRLRLDQRDLRAERGVDLRELTSGGSAAEHDEAARQVRRAQALGGGPGRDVGQALDRRRDRLASGRDDQVRIGQRRARPPRHLDRPRAGDPAGATDHGDPRLGEPQRGPGIVQASGHLVPAGDRVLPGLAPARGQQQRIRRQAGQIGGLAADQPGFDDRHGLTGARRLGGDVHARGPAAEHDYVESTHTSSIPPTRSSCQPGRKLAGRVGLIGRIGPPLSGQSRHDRP